MQTRDVVEGLYNCLEFSQPSSCLDEAIKTRKSALLPNSGLFELNNTGVVFLQFGMGNVPKLK